MAQTVQQGRRRCRLLAASGSHRRDPDVVLRTGDDPRTGGTLGVLLGRRRRGGVGGIGDGAAEAHRGRAARLEQRRAFGVAAVVGAILAVVDETEPVLAAEAPTIHIEFEHDIDVNLPILVTHWPLDSNPACVYPIRRDLALVALGDDSTIAHSYHACQLNGDVLVLPRSAESMVPVDRILWSEDLGQRERVRGDQRSRRPVALALGIELLLLIPMHRLVETKVSLHGRQLRTAAP
mmetsp:Transcript_31017/g.93838  ORF Transcript_31017/g.93838 Transcript_31017/m.93838 type:complete len:236 (+) Transcript_31017:54-761(+)